MNASHACFCFSRWARSLGFLALLVLATPAVADTHGPICSWHTDPTTTMTVQWIESHSYPRNEWFTAQAGFGYGDNDDKTIVSPGGHGRLYIRQVFDADSLAEAATLTLHLRYDDAFIAYLNGHEIARGGVTEVEDAESPTGTRLEIASHEADEAEPFPIADFAALLQEGENVLAIEGFNVSQSSSDFSLHPALIATADDAEATETAVIPWSSEWNVFYGGAPQADWQTETATSERPKVTVPSSYELVYRLAVEDPGADAAAASWQVAEIARSPFADSGSYVFHANLTGLHPDTRYEFLLRQRNETETENGPFAFRTAPAQRAESLKFVTGGDMFHSRELLDAMNTCAGRLDPLFALLGGDLAYANARTPGRWYAWFDSWHQCAVTPDGRMVPMILAIGNHETSGPDPEDAKFFYSLFQLPAGKTNYAVDFADYLSIVLLDSNHSQRVAAQTEWLAAALAERSSMPHLFACYHRPTYGTFVKSDLVPVRTEWVPLFEQHHVSAVFENDHHVYKRTLPIRQGEVDNERGVLYLGDGAWGVQVREIPEEVKDLAYMASWASKNHLIEVVLTDDECVYTARTADGAGFDTMTDARRRKQLIESSPAMDQQP